MPSMLPRNINNYTPDANIDSIKNIIIIEKDIQRQVVNDSLTRVFFLIFPSKASVFGKFLELLLLLAPKGALVVMMVYYI